jgi:hypothetical protein
LLACRESQFPLQVASRDVSRDFGTRPRKNKSKGSQTPPVQKNNNL